MDESTRPEGVDALPVPAVLVRASVIVAANPAAAALLVAGDGGPPAIEGQAWGDLVGSFASGSPTVDLAGFGEDASGPAPAVVRVRALATGRLLELRAAPAPTAIGHVLVALTDITAEARAEGIVGAVADSTLVLTADGLVTWQSGDVALVTAGGRGGVGRSPLELVHPEDLPPVLDTFVGALNRPGRPVRAAARSRALGEGSWQHVELTGVAVPEVPGVEGIVVQVRNVGPTHEVDSVGQTEGRFLSLTDAAPVGLIVGDVFGRTVYANDAARQVLRLPAEAPPSVDWIALVEESDRPGVAAAVDAAVYEGQVDRRTVRFAFPDGARAWLRVGISPRVAEGEQAIGVITTLEDVTVEMEARAEADRLKEMLDASSDFVLVFRPSGQLLYLNRALAELAEGALATVADEGAGSGDGETEPGRERGPLRRLIPDEFRERWLQGAREIIEHEDIWREFELQAADGRRIPVSALAVIRRTEDGALDWVALLARDITDLKAAEAQLRQAATHDHLTELPNRPLLIDRLEQAVSRHKRNRTGLAVLFCDLDGFKDINDEYGHAAGDALLVAVARRLREIVRESDTAARVGGDEFVVVAEGITDTEVLATLAERIIDAVTADIELEDGRRVRVGISIGIGVALPRNGEVDPDRLLTLADGAMYRAKARGGSRFRIVPLEIS